MGPLNISVDLIVPAFQEGPRIHRMLEVVTRSRFFRQIVVVDDGSTDQTFEVAQDLGVDRLLRHEHNRGKGAALATGLAATRDADLVMFLDADLVGLTEEHLHALVEPIAQDPRIGMTVGQFIEGRWSVDLQQKWFAILNGQRVLSRAFIDRLPDLNWSRFGVEILLSRYALDTGTPVATPYLRGLTHLTKEQKFGPTLGFYRRLQMYYECLRGHALYARMTHRQRSLVGDWSEAITQRRPEAS